MDFAKKCQFEYNDSTAWITLTPSNNYICTYIPNATIYNFFLTGTNSLGSFRKKFMINNHEHGKHSLLTSIVCCFGRLDIFAIFY